MTSPVWGIHNDTLSHELINDGSNRREQWHRTIP